MLHYKYILFLLWNFSSQTIYEFYVRDKPAESWLLAFVSKFTYKRQQPGFLCSNGPRQTNINYLQSKHIDVPIVLYIYCILVRMPKLILGPNPAWKVFFLWILYVWHLYNAYQADNKSVSLS